MKDLIQLIDVISTQKVRQIEIISESKENTNKYTQLFQAISTGTVTTDEEAIDLLYPNGNKKAYEKFRGRFKKRIYNTLFFIDLNKTHLKDIQKIHLDLGKLWTLTEILSYRNLRQESVQLAEQSIHQTIKYEHTLCCLNFAKMLTFFYSSSNPDKKKFAVYNNILQLKKKQYALELHIFDLKIDFVNKISNIDEACITQIEAGVVKILNENKDILTHALILDSYQILSYVYILKKQYQKSIDACKKALQYYQDKPYNAIKTKVLFREDLFFSHMYIKKFEEAEKYILLNLEEVTKGKSFYFRTYAFYSTWAAYTSNYQKLYDIIQITFANKNITQYTLPYQKLLIKKAYVHLLIKMNKIDESIQSKKLKPIRLNRFLNEVPIYSKNKRGANISIIIIQMLFLIITRKYNHAIDRIDALKQYSYRYLRKDDTFRSNCFIKMLTVIPEQNFELLAVKRHTQDLHTKLIREPIVLSEQSSNVEIIPYEILWKFTLETLGNTRLERKPQTRSIH